MCMQYITIYYSLTLRCLAASGLNDGVLMYCRNKIEILLRKPSRLESFTPRMSRSASLSISSMISFVSLQSCSCVVKIITFFIIAAITFTVMSHIHQMHNLHIYSLLWISIIFVFLHNLHILTNLNGNFGKCRWSNADSMHLKTVCLLVKYSLLAAMSGRWQEKCHYSNGVYRWR